MVTTIVPDAGRYRSCPLVKVVQVGRPDPDGVLGAESGGPVAGVHGAEAGQVTPADTLAQFIDPGGEIVVRLGVSHGADRTYMKSRITVPMSACTVRYAFAEL